MVDDGSVDGTEEMLERDARGRACGGDDRASLAAPRQGRGGARRHPRRARAARRRSSGSSTPTSRRRSRAVDDFLAVLRAAPGRRVRPRLARDAHGPRRQAEGDAALPRTGFRHRRLARARPSCVRHPVWREDAPRERGHGHAVRGAVPQPVDLRRRADRALPAAAGRARASRRAATGSTSWSCRRGTTGPGSKLRWYDFARAMVDLGYIWRERVAGRPPTARPRRCGPRFSSPDGHEGSQESTR